MRKVAQRRVESVSVVVVFPCSNFGSGFGERRKQSLLETLISLASVEALDEAVI